MDSHNYDREKEKCFIEMLLTVVKIDILFAYKFSGNSFVNACNCFKADLPFTHSDYLITVQEP